MKPCHFFPLGLSASIAAANCFVVCASMAADFLTDSGPYGVGHSSLQLVDADRNNRALRVDVWYPTDSDFQGEFAEYPLSIGSVPPVILLSDVAKGDAPIAATERFPLVVFSHGHDARSTSNTTFPEGLARHGFVVASPSHTGNVVGDLSSGGQSVIERPQDVSFVIDRLLGLSDDVNSPLFQSIDSGRIGVAGQSFGGFTANAIAAGVRADGNEVLRDDRVKAILPISHATPFPGTVVLRDIQVPTMMIVGENDEFGLYTVVRSDFSSLNTTAPTYFLSIAGAGHGSVGMDVCAQRDAAIAANADSINYFNASAGISCDPDSISNAVALRLVNEFAIPFFKLTLNDDATYADRLTQAAALSYDGVTFFADGIADANRDGRTDVADFTALLKNYGAETRSSRRGNFNRDPFVDYLDFEILRTNYVGDLPPFPDYDSNGRFDELDVDYLSNAVRTGIVDIGFDLDGSGNVDSDDINHFVGQILCTYLGDANLDGEFNSGDLVTLFSAGQYEDATEDNSGWASGDWNADGDFDSTDVVAAFADGGYEQGPRMAANVVPEPTSILMVIVSLIVVAIRRQRVVA